jgi:hypothetical protein
VADADLSPAVLEPLRAVCGALPESYEEDAWVGTRWRIRKKTFAHVLLVDRGWPPAYARAVGRDGPVTVLTFRTPEPDLYRHRGDHPWFWPGWFPDLAGIVVDGGTDWDEVGELVTESYCLLAPRKLVAHVERPGGPRPPG